MKNRSLLRRMAALSLLIFSLALAACDNKPGPGAEKPSEAKPFTVSRSLGAIKLGMTREEIVKAAGEPQETTRDTDRETETLTWQRLEYAGKTPATQAKLFEGKLFALAYELPDGDLQGNMAWALKLEEEFNKTIGSGAPSKTNYSLKRTGVGGLFETQWVDPQTTLMLSFRKRVQIFLYDDDVRKKIESILKSKGIDFQAQSATPAASATPPAAAVPATAGGAARP
ncbi:MAG: hypothetical protein GMKNLPBB_00956 [Myxococcota bacterium]|nr:hypothetical protein [Myxococcota bacterium]